MEHDELAQYLDSLKREDCYRVDEVLKESAHETTQRVFFVGENGSESGPFIRKFIQQESGLGSAYQRVFEAQRDGRRFKHIPDILECYARDGQLVVVVEYVRGDTLQEVVYQEDPSLDLARRVFPQICDAVTELHTEFDPPIIHRDLKPSNVILTGQGLALIDFGISREYREQADCDTTHFGTREFAPPEQFGFGQTGVYSDVYSLGMVLYFCLTEQIPSLRARQAGFADPRIPECMRAVIERACAFDPAMRFASASDLKEAFRGAASSMGQPHAAHALSQDASGKRGLVAKGAVLAASVVICVLITVSGMFALLSQRGSGLASSMGASASAEGSGEVAEGTSERSLQESDIVEGLEVSGQPRDSFDPLTNFTVEVAGVEFQLPSCFKAKTSVTDDGKHYYYAETGSGAVMIMTGEWSIGGKAGSGADDLSEEMGGFIEGVMKSRGPFEELVSSTDCMLAGYVARIATFRGSVENLPVKTKLVCFYDPDTGMLGAVVCGQTTNAQFDYSGDFAKVITSAKPADT